MFDALFRALFDLSGEAILITDAPTRVVRDVNPAACALLGYTRDQLIGMRTADLVHPDSLELYTSVSGKHKSKALLVGRRVDGSAVDVDVSIREVDVPDGMLRVLLLRPITDQARAFQLLESRVAQRTRELTGLLQVSRAVSGTLQLRPLLGVVLDELAALVDYSEASVMCVEGNDLSVLDYRGPHAREKVLALRRPVEQATAFQAVLKHDGPVIVDDLLGDSEAAREYRADGFMRGALGPATARALLAVPLRVNDRIIGQLRLEHTTPGFYSWGHADLALAIANQAAIAIDNARLFEEADRRRRELQALYTAEEALYRTLEPSEVVHALLDAATDLLHADKTSVLLWDAAHERLTVNATRGFKQDTLAEMSYALGEGISTLAAQTGDAVVTEDAQTDPRISPRLRAIDRAEGIHAMISVPIKLGSVVFGVFNLQYCDRHAFTDAERRLMQSLVQRAAIALDNARTFAAERATRERLDVALAAGRMGTWEWDVGARTVHWSPRLEEIHGLEPGTFPGTIDSYLDHIHPDDRERVGEIIAESLATGEIELEYRVRQSDGSMRWFEATGRAIRDAQGQLVGMHGVCQDITSRKDAETERARHAEHERATLEAQATLEERHRLARELHDSVSQALYGIALGSQTAIAALREDDGEAAQDALQYVHKLAEASMAEMRALILELRPETLEQDGLVIALERQVAALRTRHALHVDADLGGEPDVPLDQKEALYRIAQEGVHNAVKHARASALRLHLYRVEHQLALEIADNGIGFDPNLTYAGHLGLTSMRERAAAAGGTLDIQSRAGAGTRVTVRVPTHN